MSAYISKCQNHNEARADPSRPRGPSRGLAILVATALLLAAPVSGAGAEDKCLDNNGARTINANATYSDATGTWVCAPNDNRSSAGGWLLTLKPDGTAPEVQPTAIPISGSQPTTVPAPPQSRGSGAGLIILILAV